MEEKSNGGTKKLTPSLPPNYISIIQLRERWNNEKLRKQKEEDEEQRRIQEEEDLKKESVGIVSERGDCEVSRDEGLGKTKKKKNKGKSRKRCDSRKKRNHDLDECGSIVTEIDTPVGDGSIAMPVYVVKESNAPVSRVYGEKGGAGEEAKGNGPREIAMETKFEDVVLRDEGLGKKKKKTRRFGRKKKNQEVVAVEEDVVECGMEKKTLVKDVVRVYREKAKGKEPRENVVAIETQLEDLVPRDEGFGKKKKKYKKKKKNQDLVAVGECESVVTEKKTPLIQVYREKQVYKEAVTAIEGQFEKLSIQRGETKDLKERTRSGKFGNRRKKTMQDVVAVEETRVQCEATVRAKKTLVKGVKQVYQKKVEKAKGNGSLKEAVTAIETPFENLSIKTKEIKAETTLSNHNRPNQRRDLRSKRAGMDAATMVWVKKGQNERDDGIGNAVMTLSA